MQPPGIGVVYLKAFAQFQPSRHTSGRSYIYDFVPNSTAMVRMCTLASRAQKHVAICVGTHGECGQRSASMRKNWNLLSLNFVLTAAVTSVALSSNQVVVGTVFKRCAAVVWHAAAAATHASAAPIGLMR
jgi:hypothetical protein